MEDRHPNIDRINDRVYAAQVREAEKLQRALDNVTNSDTVAIPVRDSGDDDPEHAKVFRRPATDPEPVT